MRILWLAFCAVLIGLAPAEGRANSLATFVGESWETGGFPPSLQGDVLQMVGTVGDITPPLTADPQNFQYTIYLSNLVSQGQNQTGSVLETNYSGGLLQIYEDNTTAADPGTGTPPNGDSPNTYIDGALYLQAAFDSFILRYDLDFDAGTFDGDLTFNGGSNLGELGAQTDGYTFGGVFFFQQITAGYDLQWDGQIVLNEVPVRTTTWGRVKTLFRD